MDFSLSGRRPAAMALPGLIISVLLGACAAQPPGPPVDPAATDGQVPVLPTPEITTSPTGPPEPIPELQEGSLFFAVYSALNAGDWMAAQLALPKPAPDPAPASDVAALPLNSEIDSDPNTTLWRSYFQARIALLRGATREHAQSIAALASSPLPLGLRRELLWHQLQQSLLRSDPVQELQLSERLLRIGAHPRAGAPFLEDTIWQAAQRSNARGLSAQPGFGSDTARGWLELAAAGSIGDAAASGRALADWIRRHPGHRARNTADQLLTGAERDAAIQHVALVLPLSGPLSAAGDAVSRGFVAAYFADKGNASAASRSADLSIEVLDSRRFETVGDAYSAAVNGEADVVVGPLGKLQVDALLAQAVRETPILTLNRTSTPQLSDTGALLLSLAPEDEAEQLADVAFAGGARRALLIRPDGEWGDRMENALRRSWSALGGQLPATAKITQPSRYSEEVSAALGLDGSAQRSRSVREVFNQPVETSGRRRGDLDSVFLLTRSNEEASALKPLIDYHYAGDLNVYALSTADSNSNDPLLNADLNGVTLLATPWRLAPSPLPGRVTLDSRDSFVALHALGVDAYTLARRWWRTHNDSRSVFPGQSAVLGNNLSGTLTRTLPVAEFDRGVLRAH